MKKENKTFIYDTEVFPNLTLVILHDIKTGKRAKLIGADKIQSAMRRLIKKYKVMMVGYNNFHYDDLIVRCAMNTGSDEACHNRSMRIITSTQLPKDLFSEQYETPPWHLSADIFACLNRKGSLKEHECRLGLANVAECPVPFDQPIATNDIPQAVAYCENDIDATLALFNQCKPLLHMRTVLKRKFSLQHWAHCSTEPQLAQQCILAAHKKVTGKFNEEIKQAADKTPANQYRGGAASALLPRPIIEQRDCLKLLRGAELKADDPKGQRFTLEHQYKNLAEPQPHGDLFLQVGVGGLHSVDAPGLFRSTDAARIIDLDVTSYYPSIIINRKLCPSQLQETFLQTYTRLRDDRLIAKKAGNKALSDALKIVINSTFGKLNDVYSPLRSITAALSVTLTGQYNLIELITMLQDGGIRVLSANTDGVTCLVSDAVYCDVARKWEKLTGYRLEETEYKTYARRDVNNYIAETIDGKIKRKGIFENPKGNMPIVNQAAEAYLLHATPCADTVRACADLAQFLCFGRIKNGGTVWHGDTLVGKIARWYVAKSGETIRRKNPNETFAKSPHGDNAQLAMRYDAMADDVDYDYYISEAEKIAKGVIG